MLTETLGKGERLARLASQGMKRSVREIQGTGQVACALMTLHDGVQNVMRTPTRNCRDRPIASADCVASTRPKFALLTLPFGLAKCGVLVALNASRRNCSSEVLILKERNSPRSRF